MNRRGFLKGIAAWAAAPVIMPVLPSIFVANPVVKAVTGGYSPASNLSNPQALTAIYYNKKFIANLKAQTPFMRVSELRDLPPVDESKKVQFFMYQPLHADLTNV